MQPETQRHLINEVYIEEEEMLKKHKFLNLVPKDWWNTWCSFVGFYDEPSGEDPGAIRNIGFVDGENYKADLESQVKLVTPVI